MPAREDGRISRDQQILAIVQDFLARKSQGDTVCRGDIAAKHPELLPELESELRKAEIVHVAQRSSETTKDEPTIIVNIGLQRCPNCHNSLGIEPGSDVQSVACPTCGYQVSLLPTDLDSYTVPAKTNLKHYEIIEQLGIGAFGTVFKARDTKLDRLVAVKVPNKGQLSDLEAEKFLREARAAGQLSHPNIASVYEVADDRESPYIVSEFIRGINLSQRLDSKKFTIQETVSLGRSIADALHHAHECGVTHRDLKPSNIMIDHHNEPHLLDFGLAKREVGEITMTSDGETLGTPAYMSPEQARGESHRADRRSDIYSLGAILYQLITDDLPFRGTIQGIIYQTIHDPPQPPSKLNRTVPKDLETIVLKCLEKDPKDRYDSAAAVEQELERFAAGASIEARPIGPMTKFFRWSKRNRVATSFAAIAFLLLMTLSIVSSVAYLRTSDALDRSREAEKQERLARQKSDRLAERERRALIQSEEEKLRAQRAEQQAINARNNETQLRDKFKSALLDSAIKIGVRDPEIAALHLAHAGIVENSEVYAPHSRMYLNQRPTPVRATMLQRLHKESGAVEIQSEFSADENFLLLTAADGRCRLWNLEEDFIVNLGDSIIAAVFCHGTNHIALAKAGGGLEFLKLDGTTVVQRINDVNVQSLASGDADSLAVATGGIASSELQILAYHHDDTWRPKKNATFSFPSRIAAMRFSNSGKKLAIACSDNFARFLEFDHHTWTKMALAMPHKKLAPHGFPVWFAPIFLDDDNLVATVSDRQQITLSGFDDNKETVISIPSSPFQISASHDQTTLVISMFLEAWIIDVKTGARGEVSGFANSVRTSVAMNNQVIITGSADRTVRFWDRSPNVSGHSFEFEEDFSLQTTRDVADLKLSQNGNNLVVVQVDGLISVWDLRSNSVPVHAIRVNGTDTRARFNATGDQIVLTGSHNHSDLYESQVFRIVETGLKMMKSFPLRGILTSSRFSDDGKRLVTCSASQVAKKAEYDTIVDRSGLFGDITVWSTDDNSVVFRFPTTLAADALFSADGKTVFALLFSGDVIALNVESGGELWHSKGVLAPIDWQNYISPKWLELSTGGNHLFVSGNHSVVILNSENGLIDHRIEHYLCCDFDVSSDQTKIATSSFDGDVHVWDVATGKELCAPLEHPDWVFRVQFSPDGQHLLTACRDRNARVWSWRENKLARSKFSHTDEVFDAFFHPRGFIVTVSRGRFVQIWDTTTGLPMGPQTRLDITPYQTAMSSDGQFIVVGGADSALVNLVRLGSILESIPNTDSLLRQASLVSSRSAKIGESRVNLTPSEWLQMWNEYKQSENPIYKSDAKISTTE